MLGGKSNKVVGGNGNILSNGDVTINNTYVIGVLDPTTRGQAISHFLSSTETQLELILQAQQLASDDERWLRKFEQRG